MSAADRCDALRVALFSGNYNYLKEGANQALNRLVEYLEGRGDRVNAYSPVTDTPAFEPAGTLVPVPSVTLPFRREFRLALGLPGFVKRDLRAAPPDIVHLSTPDILDTRAQTYARRLGIPVVASLHTRFETYLDYYGLSALRPLLEAHLHRFYRRCDMVLAPNAALVEEMKAVRGDDRVRLWSRGVDTELFHPERRSDKWRRVQGWGEDDIVLLFFGRLVIEKGVEDFIAAVRRIRAQGRTVRVLVVGAGPAEPRFAALDDVLMTGHLQDAALASAVASADILFNPSRTEAFGNVVLEAMAAGLAIVSADAPSAAAMLRDGETGLLCPCGDIDRYVAAIVSLIDAPDRRRALGHAAAAVSRDYSWAAASRQVRDAYAEVLANRSLA